MFEASQTTAEEVQDSVWEILARLETEGFKLEKFMPKLVNQIDPSISKDMMITHIEATLKDLIKAIKPTELCTFLTSGRSYIH